MKSIKSRTHMFKPIKKAKTKVDKWEYLINKI